MFLLEVSGETLDLDFTGLPPCPLPEGAVLCGLAVAPVAIAFLFKARIKDWPMITLSCWAGYLGAKMGGVILDPELAAFFGALAVGLLGKLQSAIRAVPATVTIVPGILLLVPGSIGFGSFHALLTDQTAEGLDAAFSMFVVAASLVTGLLAAHAMTTRR